MLAVKVFAEDVAEQVKGYLPPEFQKMECRVTEQQKNNEVLRVGIRCHMPDSTTEPILYMEPYYDMIRQGEPLNDVMERIAHEVEASSKVRFSLGEIRMESYDMAKEHLSVRLVSKKANRRMLLDVPHRDLDDLSAVCRMEIPVLGEGRMGSIPITNEILKRWGVGEEELFEAAVKNMRESNPPFLMDMKTAVMSALSDDLSLRDNLLEHPECRDPQTEFYPMYVLTTLNKFHGAAALVCPGVMEKVSGMFPEGFYILPSSVHELILLPKREGLEEKELGQMVRDINREQVAREEVLSDHVYEYDRERGRVCSVPESMERIREVER